MRYEVHNKQSEVECHLSNTGQVCNLLLYPFFVLYLSLLFQGGIFTQNNSHEALINLHLLFFPSFLLLLVSLVSIIACFLVGGPLLVWHSFLSSFSLPFFAPCIHAMGNDTEAIGKCNGNGNHEALSRTHLVMTLNTSWQDSNVKMLQTAPGWQCTASPCTNKNICRVKILNVYVYARYIRYMCSICEYTHYTHIHDICEYGTHMYLL